MTLNQLYYATKLNKFKNFKKASEHLGISQPALSLQVQKLEEEIGISLFNRSTKPLEVTEDGELFLTKAQELLNSANQLSRFSQEITESFVGQLKVGIIPTLAPFLIPLFTTKIQDKYPNFMLDIHESITENVVKSVKLGEYDVGIISTPITTPGIQSIPLFYEEFYLYISDKSMGDTHEMKLEDIPYDNLWLLDEGNCFRDQVNDLCDLNKVRKEKSFIYHSNSIDSLIRMVDSMGGVTILPELSTLSLSGDQEANLRSISGIKKVREISLIVTKNFDKRRFIQKLEEHIKSNIPKHMLKKENFEIVDPNIHLK
ncbi:MAG: LysR substrate-binding domain-containing protein [Bacteroidota bacterium]